MRPAACPARHALGAARRLAMSRFVSEYLGLSRLFGQKNVGMKVRYAAASRGNAG